MDILTTEEGSLVVLLMGWNRCSGSHPLSVYRDCSSHHLPPGSLSITGSPFPSLMMPPHGTLFHPSLSFQCRIRASGCSWQLMRVPALPPLPTHPLEGGSLYCTEKEILMRQSATCHPFFYFYICEREKNKKIKKKKKSIYNIGKTGWLAGSEESRKSPEAYLSDRMDG